MDSIAVSAGIATTFDIFKLEFCCGSDSSEQNMNRPCILNPTEGGKKKNHVMWVDFTEYTCTALCANRK